MVVTDGVTDFDPMVFGDTAPHQSMDTLVSSQW